MSVTYSALQHR